MERDYPAYPDWHPADNLTGFSNLFRFNPETHKAEQNPIRLTKIPYLRNLVKFC